MPAVAQDASWERLLPDVAIPLRACLAGRGEAMVVDARLAPGARLEAVVQRGGDWEICVVDLPRGTVMLRTPLPAGEAPRGPHLRAFMLERRCVDATRVTDASGAELGWLAYPGCG